MMGGRLQYMFKTVQRILESHAIVKLAVFSLDISFKGWDSSFCHLDLAWRCKFDVSSLNLNFPSRNLVCWKSWVTHHLDLNVEAFIQCLDLRLWRNWRVATGGLHFCMALIWWRLPTCFITAHPLCLQSSPGDTVLCGVVLSQEQQFRSCPVLYGPCWLHPLPFQDLCLQLCSGCDNWNYFRFWILLKSLGPG